MRTLAALVCLAALAQPVAATPILELRTGPNCGPDEVDAAVSPGSGEQFFDLTFLQDWEDPDDQMNRYDLIVRAPRPGITLLRAEKPDNWVFSDPDAALTVVEGDAGHLVINASSPDERVNLTKDVPVQNAARIYYSVDPDAAPRLYNIRLDEGRTRIYTADETGWVPPPVGVTDSGLVLVTPEPSGLAVLAFGGLLALRRRRAGPRSGSPSL